jgi:ribonuclease HI
MNVTLMTDASWCPHTKVGGFGWWCVSDRGGVPGGGLFTRNPDNATVAEMMAVVRSLHECIKGGHIKPQDEVLIQLDCMAAIEKFWGKQLVSPGSEQEVVGLFWRLVRETPLLDVQVRHVKGHSRSLESRYRSNDKCDRRAKEFMRKERDRILSLNERLYP